VVCSGLAEGLIHYLVVSPRFSYGSDHDTFLCGITHVYGQLPAEPHGWLSRMRAEKVSLRPEPFYSSKRALGRGDKHVELAFFGTYFGNIDVEVASRIGLELVLLSLVAFPIRQAADAIPLKATVRRRSGQVRQCGLQGIRAVIE
jgi:hypothetical protein